MVHESSVDVRLSNQRDFIPGFAEKIGNELCVWRKFAFDIGNGAGGVRVKAGENCGARGKAERVDAERVAEDAAFFANAIDVWRAEDFIAGERRFVGAEAFAKYTDDVGAVGARLLELLGERLESVEARCGCGNGASDIFQDCATILHLFARSFLQPADGSVVHFDGMSKAFLMTACPEAKTQSSTERCAAVKIVLRASGIWRDGE